MPTTLAVERPTTPIDDDFEVDGIGFDLHCTGHGNTTVLLIAGWGAGDDESWSAVHPTLAEQARVSSLGDLPLTVITADRRTSPGLAAAELSRLDEVWGEGVETWAALSSPSTVVTVTDTGHNIQLEHPDVVIEEVAKHLEATP